MASWKRQIMIWIRLLITIHSFLCGFSDSAASTNILRQGNSLNSSQTLKSARGDFLLGFFRIGNSEGNSNNYYLGIRYITYIRGDNDTNTVWIANRDKPIHDGSGILTLDGTGKLMINHKEGNLIEIYHGNESTAVNTSLTLQNDGNLVLREVSSKGSSGRVLWQSFDYPTDTLLPGMKLGVNHKTGRKWSLTSWLFADNPASGAFTLDWDPKGLQLVTRRQRVIYWTSGEINSYEFKYLRVGGLGLAYDLINVTNADEEYFTYSVIKDSFMPPTEEKGKFMLSHTGNFLEGDLWRQDREIENCYGYNTDNGCVKWEQPKCRSSNNKFDLWSGVFIKPNGEQDEGLYRDNGSVSRSDCRAQCWNDCDCLGFRTNFSGTGCFIWRGNLTFKQDKSGASGNLDRLITESPSKGLACVEHSPLDRPTISEVVSMLEDESLPLPMLKKPAFLNHRMLNIEEEPPKKEKSTLNGLSISTMNPR
nr:G-type lectin S-receptor-like serine/threonine-protein kinase At1g67520 [Ziziphus jujuba var. spinosa]